MYFAQDAEAVNAKLAIAGELVSVLSDHTQMEEAFVYPRMKHVFGVEGSLMVDTAFEEHADAKELIIDLQMLDPDDPQFEIRMHVLRTVIAEHMLGEESELLVRMEKEFTSEEIEEITQLMTEFRGFDDER